MRPEFLRRLQKQLDLTPAQHEEIAKIMSDSQERSWPLWDKIAPQMKEELKRVHKEIRQVLTPEQQKRWDDLLKARPRKAEAAAARAARPVPNSPEPCPPTRLDRADASDFRVGTPRRGTRGRPEGPSLPAIAKFSCSTCAPTSG